VTVPFENLAGPRGHRQFLVGTDDASDGHAFAAALVELSTGPVCGYPLKEATMQIPVLRGLIDRRLLVNFRVDPVVLPRLLPAPFRPKLVQGIGMAGVCLIRLKDIRPRWLPSFLGISSENAAHRIAVEWDHQGKTQEGVFIPRRDTSSRLNTLAGGTLFPGVHHHAAFHVQEHADRYRIELNSDDRHTHLLVDGHVAQEFPTTSVFGSLREASAFFEKGSLGYSVTAEPGQFDGLELRSFHWQVQPLAVEQVESSFFEDRGLFPAGSVELDCALLMRGIEHEWHDRGKLCAAEPLASPINCRPLAVVPSEPHPHPRRL
jgi:hypothetical protein